MKILYEKILEVLRYFKEINFKLLLGTFCFLNFDHKLKIHEMVISKTEPKFQ